MKGFLEKEKKKYLKWGLDELLKVNYDGYEGRLTSKQEEELKQHMREHLMGSAKEIVTLIKDKYGSFLKKKKARGEYYENLTEFRENIIKFFNNFASYGRELESLLTENFQLVGT